MAYNYDFVSEDSSTVAGVDTESIFTRLVHSHFTLLEGLKPEFNEQIRQWSQSYSELDTKVVDLQSKTESRQHDYSRLETEIGALKKTHAGIHSKLKGFKQAVKDMEVLLQRERDDKNKVVLHLKRSNHLLLRQLQDLSDQNIELNNRVTEQAASAEKTTEGLQYAQNEIRRLSRELTVAIERCQQGHTASNLLLIGSHLDEGSQSKCFNSLLDEGVGSPSLHVAPKSTSTLEASTWGDGDAQNDHTTRKADTEITGDTPSTEEQNQRGTVVREGASKDSVSKEEDTISTVSVETDNTMCVDGQEVAVGEREDATRGEVAVGDEKYAAHKEATVGGEEVCKERHAVRRDTDDTANSNLKEQDGVVSNDEQSVYKESGKGSVVEVYGVVEGGDEVNEQGIVDSEMGNPTRTEHADNKALKASDLQMKTTSADEDPGSTREVRNYGQEKITKSKIRMDQAVSTDPREYTAAKCVGTYLEKRDMSTNTDSYLDISMICECTRKTDQYTTRYSTAALRKVGSKVKVSDLMMLCAGVFVISVLLAPVRFVERPMQQASTPNPVDTPQLVPPYHVEDGLAVGDI